MVVSDEHSRKGAINYMVRRNWGFSLGLLAIASNKGSDNLARASDPNLINSVAKRQKKDSMSVRKRILCQFFIGRDEKNLKFKIFF